MNDAWILLIYPGLPVLLVILSPWLSQKPNENKGWQALWLSLGVITGPIIGGMWGLVGGILHLLGECFCNSILWHIIPFVLIIILGLGVIVPRIERYTGRSFFDP